MRNFNSARLIPLSFPVIIKVLLFKFPSFLICVTSWIFRILLSSIKILRLSLLEKKFFNESTWVSPIPSISFNSLKFLWTYKSINFWELLKYFANIFAFSNPICLIPKAKMNFSNEIFFFSLIEYFKFETDNFPQPSNFSILS